MAGWVSLREDDVDDKKNAQEAHALFFMVKKNLSHFLKF